MHRANGITRQQILTHVKTNGSMTAEGLGRELGISPVAVRQHLTGLEAEGVITTTVERKGLGRPVHRYSLTSEGDESFPRDYAGLANSLLDEVQAEQGPNAVDRLLASRRHKVVANNRARLQSLPFAARAREVARMQTESGFMASLEENEGAARIIQYNCAVCRIARSHREVCTNELRMIQELIGDDAIVERETYMMTGDHTCTYIVKPK